MVGAAACFPNKRTCGSDIFADDDGCYCKTEHNAPPAQSERENTKYKNQSV